MRPALGLLGILAISCGSAGSTGKPSAAPPPSPTYAAAVVPSPGFGSLGSRPVLQAAMRYSETPAAVEPPVSLTAPDGTGLALRSLHARAVVEGPLAFTELLMEFENPNDRVIEGRFSITLPDGAAISRFAMKIDGGWMEAEVVEKMAARRAYEDFLHRRQDPALLEKEAGNQFRARIFPIPAKGIKAIRISYSQELARGDEPYALPLVGWPKMDSLDVAVRRGGEVSRLARTNYEPTADFEVSQATDVSGLRNGALAVARVAPKLPADAEAIDDLLVLVDTSASRALGYSAYVERLGSLLRALRRRHGDDMKLTVAAFDQGVELIYAGDARSFGETHLRTLLQRRPLGASNLHGALAWAAERGAAARVVIVGDGIATAGKTDGDSLEAAVKALAPKTERVDAVLAGGIRDDAMMLALTRGSLERDGVVLDASEPTEVLAGRLSSSTVSGVTVAVEGASWVWPETIDGVQPGDEVLVFAQLPTKDTDAVTVELGGPIRQAIDVELATTAARPLLERAAAMAQIRRLEAKGDPKLKDQIVAHSIEHRVLSDHTALLVLETEQDYARFDIDRKSLTEILIVGEHGVELMHRTTMVVPKPTAAPNDGDANRRASKGRKTLRAAGDGFAGDKDAFIDVDGKPDEAVEMKELETTAAPAGDDVSLRGATAVENDYRVDAPAPSPEPAREAPAAGGIAVERNVQITGRVARPDVDQVVEGGNAGAALVPAPPPEPEKPKPANPYTGKFAAVMKTIAAGAHETALVDALAWRADDPGDVMALVALGEALEANGNAALAARAYGSIIDLYPSRADMRRFAGERLERLGAEAASLAVDTFAKAVEQRADHPSSHRLYAWALLRAGEHAKAFAAMDAALSRQYPGGRFAGVDRIMREDLALIGAAWIKADASKRKQVLATLEQHGAKLATGPSTRFVMTWETDANDVDLHIYDAKGNHAWYSQKQLASGGELYADVTTGYGPEAIVIPGKPKAGPYHLQAHYYSRGPMGYGMGTLDVIEHDGNGGFRFAHHPFVIMNDDAYVDLLPAPTSAVETR